MIERKCSTCKHFEAAPMWKKGWCRNPLLYSPQQSHLVGEDDLDCNRGMGSYWEALDSDLNEDEPVTRFTPPPPRTIAPAAQGPGAIGPAGARGPQPPSAKPVAVRREQGTAASSTVSVPRPQARRAEPLETTSPEGYNDAATSPQGYSPGEYLRQYFPVITVILALGALWIWSAQFFPQRQSETGTPTVVATVPANLGQPPTVITPTAPPAPTPPAPPAPEPGVIAPGARVVVNAAGNGANIRERATTSAALVTTVQDGTALTITGASQEANGFTWWPVQGEGFTGWVAGSLIEAAP